MNEKAEKTDAQAGLEWLAWIIGGAAYGVLLRVFFGYSSALYAGPMSMAFLVGTPLAVGALTVYGARNLQLTIWDILFRPWATVLLMLIGCAAALLEGSICLAMLTPLFLICGSIGGLIMSIALKLSGLRHRRLRAVALLPLLMVLGETHVPTHNDEQEIRRSVQVNAPPETVWREILTARSIKPDEMPFSLTHFIGVPKPIEGVNVTTPEGELRYSTWEKGVNFRALVTDKQELESITWRYLFDADSFPKGSMDEHVEIGGRYFDLYDTTFNLQRLPGNKTRLELIAHYRVTSSINFYAVPAAEVLGNDFVATILALYKGRSERAAEISG